MAWPCVLDHLIVYTLNYGHWVRPEKRRVESGQTRYSPGTCFRVFPGRNLGGYAKKLWRDEISCFRFHRQRGARACFHRDRR